MNLGCFHLRQGTSDYLEACSKDNDVSSEETHPPSINQSSGQLKNTMHQICSSVLGIADTKMKVICPEKSQS